MEYDFKGINFLNLPQWYLKNCITFDFMLILKLLIVCKQCISTLDQLTFAIFQTIIRYNKDIILTNQS